MRRQGRHQASQTTTNGTIPVSAVINQDASWPTATAHRSTDSPSERSTHGSMTFYTVAASSPQLAGRSCTLNQAVSISSETWEQLKYAHLGRKRHVPSAVAARVLTTIIFCHSLTPRRPSENPGATQFFAILYLDSYMVLVSVSRKLSDPSKS